MLPPDQRFRTAEPGRITLNVILRLIEYLELAPLDRIVQIVQQPLVQKLTLMHVLVIGHQRALVIPAHHVAGGLGPVKHKDRFDPLPPGHHAHAQMNADIGRDLIDPLLETIQQSPVIRLLQAVQVEAVRFDPAGDSLRLSEKAPDLFSDQTQHFIAEFPAVHRIDGVKLLDVHNDGVHVHLRVIAVQPACVLKEEIPGIQMRQPVILRSGDQLLALTQLQNPVHARQDDLRDIERLRNKVHGTHLKRLKLRVFIRGQHDHRKMAQPLVLPDPLHHLITVHHRHVEVKKHNRQIVFMPVHRFQCFFPVLCVDQVIVILQDNAERIPVDLDIIHNQNKLRTFNCF